MVTTNLIAHKERNQLTSIIYSLTLGSMIFLVVCSNLMVSMMATWGGYSDASIVIENKAGHKNPFGVNNITGQPFVDPALITPILMEHEEEIDNFGYITYKVDNAVKNSLTN